MKLSDSSEVFTSSSFKIHIFLTKDERFTFFIQMYERSYIFPRDARNKQNHFRITRAFRLSSFSVYYFSYR